MPMPSMKPASMMTILDRIIALVMEVLAVLAPGWC